VINFHFKGDLILINIDRLLGDLILHDYNELCLTDEGCRSNLFGDAPESSGSAHALSAELVL